MLTGIVLSSVLMHRNSPVTHISAAHTKFMTHLKIIGFQCNETYFVEDRHKLTVFNLNRFAMDVKKMRHDD